MNEPLRSHGITISASCLLHVGLVTGLVLSQHWVIVTVSAPPPVLPVRLVTLDAPAVPRRQLPARPAPVRRERVRRPELVEPPKPTEAEPPPPLAIAPVPAPVAAAAPAAPTPAPPAAEAAPAPGPAATIIAPSTGGGDHLPLPEARAPVPVPAVARRSAAAPEGLTRYARPQGGYQVQPIYPSTPRRLGIQGTTLLRVHVLADGRIGEVLVEKSAGHPDLDEAAAKAVRRWRFDPARRGPEAVAMWVLLPVEFRLR